MNVISPIEPTSFVKESCRQLEGYRCTAKGGGSSTDRISKVRELGHRSNGRWDAGQFSSRRIIVVWLLAALPPPFCRSLSGANSSRTH
jgi:hypothetical protein